MPGTWLPSPLGRVLVRAGLLATALGVAAQPAGVLVAEGRLAAVAGATGLCLLRAVLVRTDRAAWAVLGLGLLGWTVNAVRWLTGGPRTARLPSVLDGLPLLFFLGAVACVLLLLRSRSAGRAPRVLLADGLIGLLAACAAAVAVVGPQLGTIGGGPYGAIALAYVVLDVVLAAVVLAAITASGFHDRVWPVLAGGIGLYLATDAAYTVASAAGAWRIGDGQGLGWSAGIALLGAAAWVRPVQVAQLRLRLGTVLAVPLLSVAVAVAVLASEAWAEPQPVAVLCAVAVVVAGAVRATSALVRSYSAVASAEQAVTDELTGLANRRQLLARLDAALADGAGPHALVLLDLDRFKEINDTLGHPVGDELLRRLGPRLAGTARPGETVARLGGDEFAVLLPGVDSEAGGLRAAERVLAGLVGAFVIDGLTLFVAGSAGVALAPRHGTDGPTLLRRADVAMYQAKRGGGGAAVYRPLADPHTRSRLGAATELKRAVAGGGIVCAYQPQVALPGRAAVGVEALARWADPRRGLVPPAEFLGLAEQTGQLTALGDVVLRTALADLGAWPGLRIAVNLSAGALLDSGLPTRTAAALDAAGRAADALTLEVADGALPDAGRARATVERLHELGVRVALDDYGNGRSSLLLLRELPVDQVKLAGTLVAALATDPRARAIVRHTVLMAHELGLEVVAKGVEDERTLAAADELGCDLAQGHQLAVPMTAAELSRWLAASGSPLAHSRPGRLEA